jgi:hypothetical protein
MTALLNDAMLSYNMALNDPVSFAPGELKLPIDATSWMNCVEVNPSSLLCYKMGTLLSTRLLKVDFSQPSKLSQ